MGLPPDNGVMTTNPSTIGWLAAARRCESPNANERPDGCVPEMIVLHNISLPPGQFGTGDIEAFFCNSLDCSKDPFFAEIEGLEVSAHFLVARDGVVTQFVSCDMRAWHAGASQYGSRSNCNDFSIGIELEGTDDTPYTNEQYTSLSKLILELRQTLPTLVSGALVAHSDIAPGRKTDPGPAFDWARLRRMLTDQSFNQQ